MKNVHLDFETYCELSLPAVGVHRYVEHPSFRVLCVAWRVDNGPVASARVIDGGFPVELRSLLGSTDVQGHAWNAAFERTVLRRLGIVPARELSCTMQRALAYGLPASLKKAAPALGLAISKDQAGHRLMMRMSRPPWPPEGYTRDDWAGLLAYCEKDVEVEAAVADRVPELIEEERLLACIDAQMNDAGIWVDEAQAQVLKAIAREAERQEALACADLTEGAVTSPGTQSARLLKWLQARCVNVPDVARATVEEYLAAMVKDRENPDAVAVEEVLQIRLRTARASTKKLARMLEMASHGGRLRGQFQFLGAGRTGRWSGRGIQPQNLPRVPAEFSPLAFVRMAACDAGLDAVAPAPVLDCVAWSLRSCLGERGEAQLWGFDFAQIEARVLAWLAGQGDVLQVFRSGSDVYTWAAQQFGSQNRQLGKVLILALGFGMGAAKLKETARKIYFVTMTMDEAERFKREWRARNYRIVEFWGEIENAARKAVLRRGDVWFPVGASAIALRGSARTLQMRLPSGRVLYYHRPAVEHGGDGTLTYWGEEKGQWVKRRTWGGTLAENATQATARDVMAEAMTRVFHAMERIPVMTVHDELVYAVDRAWTAATTERIEKAMQEAPSWAGGLPIAGTAKLMSRYGVTVDGNKTRLEKSTEQADQGNPFK